MGQRMNPVWKHTLCALALTGMALACPGESFADGSAKEFRGHFEVYVEGKKKTGVVWSKRIKDVRVIRLGRNFLIFTTEERGYSYHQSTVDTFTWKPMKKDGVAKATIVKGKAKAKGKAKGKKSEKELLAEFNQLFKEIEEMVEKDEFEGVLQRFKKLDEVLDQCAALGPNLSNKELVQWLKDREGFAEMRKAIQCQIFVNRGNQILRGMAEHLKENKNGRVIRAFKDMETLCAEMRAQKEGMFHRNAKALYEKAKELKEKASKKLRGK